MFIYFYGILFCLGCSAVFLNANHFSIETVVIKLFLFSNTISAKVSIYLNKLYQISPVIKYFGECLNKYANILNSVFFQFYIEPKQNIWTSVSSCIHDVSIHEPTRYYFFEKYIFYDFLSGQPLETNIFEHFANMMTIYYTENRYLDEYRFCHFLENTIDKNNISQEIANMFTEHCSQRRLLLEDKNDCLEENITMKYFDKYIVKNICKKTDKKTDKLVDSEPIMSLIKSNVSFITVQYTNPKMKTPVTLEIPKGMYIVGNELFSPSFVLRLLNYQPCSYVFDYRYVLKIVDSNVNIIELNKNQYIKIGETSYVIENVI
jgi:hypothetical protein